MEQEPSATAQVGPSGIPNGSWLQCNGHGGSRIGDRLLRHYCVLM